MQTYFRVLTILNYFDQLKQQTFVDIFGSKTKGALSIKKTLNYSNFTKLDHDIISKKDLQPVYNNFKENIVQYETIRPPPFDLQQSLKQARKRQKASLEKHSKKFIFKNIRTCSEFAKTLRDKVRKSFLKRNSHQITIDVTNGDKAYESFIGGSMQQTPVNLRKRRLQIMRKNRGSAAQSHNQSIDKSPGLTYQEPMVAKPQQNIQRPMTSNREGPLIKSVNHRRNQTNHTMLQDSNEKNLIRFTRNIKSSTGTRRPLKLEQYENFDINEKSSRFKKLLNNPEPIVARQFTTLQNTRRDTHNQQIDHTVKPQPCMADQIKKRSLSSYCRKRTSLRDGNQHQTIDASIPNKYTVDRSANISKLSDNQTMDAKDPKALQRIVNLEKFLNKQKLSMKDKHHVTGYLDKLAQNNFSSQQNQPGGLITLNDYQWVKLDALPQQDFTALEYQTQQLIEKAGDQNQLLIDLQEEEQMIDKVLFRKQNSKPLILIQDEKQQGQDIIGKSIEDQLMEERMKRKELEEALMRFSTRIKQISKKEVIKK